MTYSVGQHPKIDDFRGPSHTPTARVIIDHTKNGVIPDFVRNLLWDNIHVHRLMLMLSHNFVGTTSGKNTKFFAFSSHANHHANLRIRILGSFHGWKEPNTMRSNADYQSRPSWSLPPGMASSRSRVYCFCGWSKTSSVVACSTSLPCCITTTSSAIWRTTARSWVMNR